ncbi:hypothetical protein F4677DRAFT_458308 [Hypoxylon crocopeplum]|nr:hypothetical protein F4677DRAFT_458308 [Hypoxylon crocopeplum]
MSAASLLGRFGALPVEIRNQVTDYLLDNNARVLLRIAQAAPLYFLNDHFNIAMYDSARRTFPNPTAPNPIPLLNHAIEMDDIKEPDFLRALINGYAAGHDGAINSIYPELKPIEPPLHAAVRCGRADIVQLLMDHDQTDGWVRYFGYHAVDPNHCRLRGRAHNPPCEPDSPANCPNAVEYGVTYFGRHGFINRQQRIEDCVVMLVLAGMVPVPCHVGGALMPTFADAIMTRMYRYAIAVIERTLELSDDNPHKHNLTNGGLSTILRQACYQTLDSNHLVQYILELGALQNCFVFPTVPERNHPVAAALHFDNFRSAARVMQAFLQQVRLLPENEQDDYAIRFLTRPGLAAPAAIYNTFDYFKAFIDNLAAWAGRQTLSNDHRRQLRILADDLTQRAFQNQMALPNAFYSIQLGSSTPLWLKRAIRHDNVAVMDAILEIWSQRGISADAELPPLPENPGHGFSAVSVPLADAIIKRNLAAIVLLLNAGATPRLVDIVAWRSLEHDIMEDLELLTRVGFFRKYFKYGHFHKGVQLFGEFTMGENPKMNQWLDTILELIEEMHAEE